MFFCSKVTLHAKKRYCERRRPGWLYIIDKVLFHQPLLADEKSKYDQIEREILEIVNYKAKIVSGMTKNNPNRVLLEYKGLTYVLKKEKGEWKVITVQFSYY